MFIEEDYKRNRQQDVFQTPEKQRKQENEREINYYALTIKKHRAPPHSHVCYPVSLMPFDHFRIFLHFSLKIHNLFYADKIFRK